MRAIGIACGAGSMLIGAKQAGFEVIGNLEWRDFSGTGTFEKYFDAPTWTLEESIPKKAKGVDLLMGHPSCGKFSCLSHTNVKNDSNKGTPDILRFVESVARLKPRFFAMDNLFKSLEFFTIQDWTRMLPEYDLFPEIVFNYGYGCSQRGRTRLFMIGSLKGERFTFVPGERFDWLTSRMFIGDLSRESDWNSNHVVMSDDEIVRGWDRRRVHWPGQPWAKLTLGEFKEYIKKYPAQVNFEYYQARLKKFNRRPGFSIMDLDRQTRTITSGGRNAVDNMYRQDTLDPLTIREKARLQGAPDDFVFLPRDYKQFHWRRSVYQQVGRFIPVQFCRFLSEQILAHSEGREFPKATGIRIVEGGKELIDFFPDLNLNARGDSVCGVNLGTKKSLTEAKKFLCESANQRSPKACLVCWVKKCEIRKERRDFLRRPERAKASRVKEAKDKKDKKENLERCKRVERKRMRNELEEGDD